MKQLKIFPSLFSTFAMAALAAFLLPHVSASEGGSAEIAMIDRHESTVKRGVIVLVEFPDVKHRVSRQDVQARFSRNLNGYVKQMSYGKVSFAFDVTERWYEMPDPISRYRISSRNLEVDSTRVGKLMADALNAADDDVDYSKYDFTVIFMAAQIKEFGMVGLCGYPGMFAWKTISVLKTRKGERVNGGVAIYCYQAHVGTLFHDIAHILGGIKDGKRVLPCLYDHDLQAKPGDQREAAVNSMIHMGFWDPMSCHFYKWGQPPPGLSSWSKLRLNWIDKDKIKVVKPGERAEVFLGPLEDGSSEVLVVEIPISRTTYYLLENRQPIGTDRFLPGSGVLIMYADDTIAECRHGKSPVRLMNADPSVPHLEGAAFDIGRKDRFVDKKNKIEIRLIEKKGRSCRILVSPFEE